MNDMHIASLEIHQEQSRDTYWGRVVLASDDGSRQTTVLVCASHEYLWDTLGIRDLSDEDVRGWMSKVAETWLAKGDGVLGQAIQYDVYANTEEGRENGLSFLQKEVRP